MVHKQLFSSTRMVLRRFLSLFKQPIFLVITVLGNLFIGIGASAFYYLEAGINPAIKAPLDCVWWAVTTVTTVGYGDITPITFPGRVVGIFLMIAGTALFASYTGFFAAALVSGEITEVEAELRQLEKSLEKMQTADALDDQRLHHLIRSLEATVAHLKNRRSAGDGPRRGA